MRDRAIEIARDATASGQGVNALREYVQSRVLGALQEAGAFVPWAFMGGTALRFLYRIPRFSEDLDFALERDASPRSFAEVIRGVARLLGREGYDVRAKVSETSNVRKAQLGFAGLPHQAGLSAHRDEVLWVKIELDACPPLGAGTEVTVVNHFGPLRIQHHDLPSLFAGKVAAVLAREYTKGRDLYDLMWYLTRDDLVEPNTALLHNALAQTSPESAESAARDWRGALGVRLATIDWLDARRDVAPFLEQPRDLELIAAETFARLL